MKHKQRVLVEVRNETPEIFVLQSNNPITFERVIEYFTEHSDFDEDEDSLTLIDATDTVLKID
jgi:hypothetical protein